MALLMCVDHWRMVPAALRREVVASNMARVAGEPGATALHRDAVTRAVAAVKEKQERKAQTGSSGSLFNG
ncbi:hypothetical protein [Ramlibacter sp.]|uniref:hypothetical protein n=1 Tax=Ramlibacter sp. TaxID=1917967 RepID=UPI003D11BBAF